MEYTIFILALPVLSFLVLALAGMKMPHKVAGAIGTLSLAAVTVLSYITAVGYFTAQRTAEGLLPVSTPWNFSWLPFTESLHIDMGIMLDPISVMMLVVISTVSLMVHIYSFGYMKGERGFQRYYAFLSLFTFSMLGLVVATNIFQMYVFWELVGVSSYLLIGFYYTKPEAIAASKKAFIVTRFADLGFLIGILLYGYYMQTFTFSPSDPETLHWVAYIGMFTAFYAATVACVQSDIKRVLAFSTISQIGFMMVALGVCTSLDPHEGGLGYMASMFHLFTHAMFKALLFLGAGCVIHAVHSNEMSFMGGLRKYMPVTHITFLIACLAIAGIPPFSGFFSKDEILTACFRFSPVAGWIMTVIAGMTAFYMFRLYYCIFWGKTNDNYAHHTPHESPVVMTLPLVILAAITVVAGWAMPFGHFVSSNGHAYDIHLDTTVAATSIVVAVIAILIATWMYAGKTQPVADMLQKKFSGLHHAAYRRFFMDEVWMFVTKKIIFRCVSTPLAWFDRHVIDQFMNFMAWSTNAAGETVQPMQSGKIQTYTMWFLGGIIVLTAALILL